MESITSVIKRTPLYTPMRNLLMGVHRVRNFLVWELRGRPAPPPHTVKQQVIKHFARKFGYRTLIETGTCRGDMIEAVKAHFDSVYSIELSPDLHQIAKERFRDNNKIELIQGDSGIELGKLLARIKEPALFWLDGHYSGGITAKSPRDPPILDELEHIFASQVGEHFIIIDDARCFGGNPGYPSLEELCNFITSRQPGCRIEVEGDSIRVFPQSAGVRSGKRASIDAGK